MRRHHAVATWDKQGPPSPGSCKRFQLPPKYVVVPPPRYAASADRRMLAASSVVVSGDFMTGRRRQAWRRASRAEIPAQTSSAAPASVKASARALIRSARTRGPVSALSGVRTRMPTPIRRRPAATRVWWPAAQRVPVSCFGLSSAQTPRPTKSVPSASKTTAKPRSTGSTTGIIGRDRGF